MHSKLNFSMKPDKKEIKKLWNQPYCFLAHQYKWDIGVRKFSVPTLNLYSKLDDHCIKGKLTEISKSQIQD